MCGSTVVRLRIAVLEGERNLRGPPMSIIEGGDQYRGWFNSSLMVGLAAHDRAPYNTVITSRLDGGWRRQERCTSRSATRFSPTKSSTNQAPRFCASGSLRPTIRKTCGCRRNSATTAMPIESCGTPRAMRWEHPGFDPRYDPVAESEMWEIDRWALAVTREVTRKAIDSYKRFDYTTVYHALYNYATVTLSNVYIDILKDRLYTLRRN